nr:unnamed protein product [Spirometra erinaceieuropaei]
MEGGGDATVEIRIDLSGSHQRQHQIMANDAILVHACAPCSQAESACSIPMDLVDAEDRSSPLSFPFGLSRPRRKNQMCGAYEEALSVSIRYLRQAPTSQQYPAHSLPPILVSAITDCDVLREMLALHGGFV